MNDPTTRTEPLGLVLTCRSCKRTYRPCGADFETGRLNCPQPDCRGWSWTAKLVEPTGGAA